MKPLLGSQAARALEGLAAEHALLAFDFDGTLAPLVPDRHGAAVPAARRELLRVVALLYPCAVVSGRARRDVARRLEDVPLCAVVGNHGAEPGFGPRDTSCRDQLVAWRRILGRELSLVPGVEIEDKGFSIAVHYRDVPCRAAGRALAHAAAAALDGARVVPGRAVVNVLPRSAPDKGGAIESLVRRLGSRPVLYVGDDRSDEPAFESGATRVGVRVGRTARSAARWYLPGEHAMDDLLRELIRARLRRDGLGDRARRAARAARC